MILVLRPEPQALAAFSVTQFTKRILPADQKSSASLRSSGHSRRYAMSLRQLWSSLRSLPPCLRHMAALLIMYSLRLLDRRTQG